MEHQKTKQRQQRSLKCVFQRSHIDAWEAWYSQSIIYHEQREAISKGCFALSDNPARLRHDMVWAEGSVQQVYGLIVPIWQTIWCAIGRIMGFKIFPDRVSLAIAISLTALMVFTTFYLSDSEADTDRQLGSIICNGGVTLILLLFPPYIGLLGARLDIYEEAVVYEYLYGLFLLCLLARHARTPTKKMFLALCIIAGLGGLLRPTLVFYGFTAVIIGYLALLLKLNWSTTSGRLEKSKKNKVVDDKNSGKERPDYVETDIISSWHLKTLVCGCLLFCFGGGLLFWTNLIRFGNGFEFGHKLNLQYMYGSMYATRYDHPYQNEPMITATKELLGLLFFAKQMNGSNYYKRDFFPGQSPTLRWREIYLKAYNLTYMPLLIGGGLAGVVAFCRLWRYRKYGGTKDKILNRRNRELAALALWGGISSAILFCFYLRNSVISSRYLMDFMPGFASLVISLWIWGCLWLEQHRGGRFFQPLFLIALCLWLVWLILNNQSVYSGTRFITLMELRQRLQLEKGKEAYPRVPIPQFYDYTTDFKKLNIPFNGAGWTPETGAVKPLIILFVEDPEYLELTVASAREGGDDAVPRHVRAKIGLEFLELENLTKADQGWVVRFRGPKAKRYQKGLQVAFIVFVPNTRLADEVTPWRLLKAQWKGTLPAVKHTASDAAAAVGNRSIRQGHGVEKFESSYGWSWIP